MAVEHIDGEVRYTGEDAQAAFSSLKSQYSNQQDDQDPPKDKNSRKAPEWLKNKYMHAYSMMVAGREIENMGSAL